MTIATVSVKGLPSLGRKLTKLEKEVFPKALVAALNRTARRVRTGDVRSIAKAMGVKQKDVRSRVTVLRAKRGGNPSVRISYKGKGLNLIAFKGRQTKKGVSASPWGNRKTFRHAFITVINGARIVMIRRKRGGGLVGRLPIRSMRGPGVAKSADDEKIAAQRIKTIEEVFPKEMSHQLEYYVSKMRPGK